MSDVLTLTSRSVRLSLRTADALLTSLLLPVVLMLVFVYLFGRAIRTGTGYVTYVVPGVILLCATFGSATTAVSVSSDMAGGIIDRLRSMHVRGPALLAGHVAASILRNLASTALVLAVGWPSASGRTRRRSPGSRPAGYCSRSRSPCPGSR